MYVLCYLPTFFFKRITTWMKILNILDYIPLLVATFTWQIASPWLIQKWSINMWLKQQAGMELVAERKKLTCIDKGLLQVYDWATVDVTSVQQWVRLVKEAETRGDFLTNCGVWTSCSAGQQWYMSTVLKCREVCLLWVCPMKTVNCCVSMTTLGPTQMCV